MAVVVSRVLDWFWLSSVERATRAPADEPLTRARELSARAALAYEAAQRTARPSEPFAHTGSLALACELYREAIRAALAAQLELRAGGSAAAPIPDLASALDRVDATMLERAAGGGEQLAKIRGKLDSGSFLDFAELPPAEQKQLAARLEVLSEGLLASLSGLRRSGDRIWMRRALHVALLAGLVTTVALGVQATVRWSDRRFDLAPSAKWTASSTFAIGGCESPEQTCEGGENYFFHTGEEPDPGITFDLGRVRGVSGLEVENRRDCCQERVKPLVISVSPDGKRWTDVARRQEGFRRWRPQFAPVKARYVKLHVPVDSAILHLAAVRIYP